MLRAAKTSIFFLVTLFLISAALTTKSYAATLKFNPSSFSLKSGEKKSVTIVLDTEGKKAFGAVGTIKITKGTDTVRINSLTPSSEIGFNEMKVSDSTSTGDSRVSFTVIKESLAYFLNTVNLATIEVEALKTGEATLEFTTSDAEPSTVADLDTHNEILTTRGTAVITVNSSSSSNNDNNDDNDSSSNSSSSSNNSSAQVPTTGSESLFIMGLIGASLVGASFAIRKFFTA